MGVRSKVTASFSANAQVSQHHLLQTPLRHQIARAPASGARRPRSCTCVGSRGFCARFCRWPCACGRVGQLLTVSIALVCGKSERQLSSCSYFFFLLQTCFSRSQLFAFHIPFRNIFSASAENIISGVPSGIAEIGRSVWRTPGSDFAECCRTRTWVAFPLT